MDDYEDLDAYSGDTVHAMFVDSDFEINTGELPELCEGSDLDDYIFTLIDWD